LAGGVGHKFKKRLHAGDCSCTRSEIRHECHRRLMEVLDEPLVVRKEERFVLLDRPDEGGAELIALEKWSGAQVEIIGSV